MRLLVLIRGLWNWIGLEQKLNLEQSLWKGCSGEQNRCFLSLGSFTQLRLCSFWSNQKQPRMQDIQSVTWSLWEAKGSDFHCCLWMLPVSLVWCCQVWCYRFGAVRALTGAAHTTLSAMSLHFKPGSSLWCETWNRNSAQGRPCPQPCHTHQCLPITSCSNKHHSLARAQGHGGVSAPSWWQEQPFG